MAIQHSVPSSLRQPGTFHEQDITSSAQGLVPLDNRVLLVGDMLAGGSATADEPVEVFGELHADDLFGEGSLAALMVRKAIETGKRIGVQPKIYAVGVADAGGTAAAPTLTVAGTATASGDLIIRIAGRLFRVGVSEGDTAAVVAAAIVDSITEKLASMPVTAASALGVVTLTARNTGVNGNDIASVVDETVAGITVTVAAGTAGSGTADPTNALDASLADYYESKAIANHAAADITVLATHLGECWAAAAKRWCIGFAGENGTLSVANTLADGANDYRIAIGSYEESPSLPCEIAAALAVAVSAKAQPNYNWDGQEIPLYAPPKSAVYQSTEIESALSGGATPLIPNDARDATEIVRLITTKTTEAGAPFERTKDVSTVRGFIYTMRQIDIALTQQFKGVNKSARVLKRMRSVCYRVLKALEVIRVVQNVDALFPQLLVESDPIVATRAIVSVPESIIQNLHQTVVKNVLYVE